jgi:FKBP-type peptidyl-prolyl cis-trans isomerase
MRSFATLLLLAAVVSCDSTKPGTASDPATETYAASLGVDLTQMTKLTPDLYIQDKTVGTGATAAVGSTITASYTLHLVDGTLVESGTLPQPGFLLGFGNLIEGWDKGIPGMKVGGSRRLIVGSTLGYGSAGSPPSIPGNATLVFDMQLLSSK